jgi:sugar phosphate isomerase/epimerase
MHPIGLEYFTLLGANPLHIVKTAAAAGCRYVSLVMTRPDFVPNDPMFSLIDDAALRRDTVACMRDNDVSIALVDGFAVFPDKSVKVHRPALDVLAELGVRRINTVSFDDNWARTVDQTAILAALAGEYGLTLTVESCPLLTVKTLEEAVRLIDEVGHPSFKLLIDTMHVSRTSEAGDVAKVASIVDYVQISDCPLAMPSVEKYTDEAIFERMVPGEGEMPLVQIMRAIPDHIVTSVEVPMRARREAGMSDLDRVRLAVEGTRKVLEAAEH